MTTRLALYNNALSTHLGERTLSSLTEARKSRRVLDTIWDNNFVKGVLEDGQWSFGKRRVMSDYDPDYTTEFGYTRKHDIPSDFARLTGISVDEYFRTPLTQYEIKDAIYTDNDTIYLEYVSYGATYGGDLAAWPENMAAYAECKMARLACIPITQDKEKHNELLRIEKKFLTEAQSMDNMQDATKFRPFSSWVRSRGARNSTYQG